MVGHIWIAISVAVVETTVTEDLSIVVVVLPAIVGGFFNVTSVTGGWVFVILIRVNRHNLIITSVEMPLLCEAFRVFILHLGITGIN